MTQQAVETTIYSLSDTPPADPEERRDGERHVTLYRVGSILIDGRRELCLIKNISAGGMRIRAYSSIAVGTRMSIELKCGVPIDGQASWINGSDAGISFDTAIDVLDVLSTSLEGPRPRMPRIEADCMVILRDGANHLRLRACDISQGGMKLRSTSRLPAGTEVVAMIPGFAPIPGRVCWSDSEHLGFSFNSPIPLRQLVEWIRARHEQARAH